MTLVCRFTRLLAAVSMFGVCASLAATKTVLLIAGPPTQESGVHEYRAGVVLLQKSLADVAGLDTRVALEGWPQPAAFEGVDAVVIFCDGGKEHLVLQENRLQQLGEILANGTGLGLLHDAVEPTKEKGQNEFLRWIGGALETGWSVKPTFAAEFDAFPIHPISRGIKEFKIRDEWGYHVRFVDDFKRLTPLLVTIPPPETASRPNGPFSGNPAVKAAVARGEPQIMAWVYERPEGGRGFGFTGGHFHANWSNDSFRKLVLNAIVWLAQVEVPPAGVESRLSAEDLRSDLDSEQPAATATP